VRRHRAAVPSEFCFQFRHSESGFRVDRCRQLPQAVRRLVDASFEACRASFRAFLSVKAPLVAAEMQQHSDDLRVRNGDPK
jgi:hypothetical protein